VSKSPGGGPTERTEIRRAATQREVFLELREVAPGLLPRSVDFPPLTLDTDAEGAATVIRDLLTVSRPPRSATQHEHLNAWVAAVEALGVIVIHTRRVAIHDARGFSLSEWPYPVIAINGSEFARPRLFTLLHEIAHLALNAGGVCDLHEARSRRSTSDKVEHFCNRVAAAILMPAREVLALSAVSNASGETRWNADELRDLANPFGTSAEAFLLRLITLGRASWDSYWNIKDELEAGYEEALRREKERQRESEGGPLVLRRQSTRFWPWIRLVSA
jgi:Zn-dependent peptidase ImmA (M78 family)